MEWKERRHVGAAQISPSEILIFGGFDGLDLSTVLIFKPLEMEVEQDSDGMWNSNFYRRNHIIRDNTIYIVSHEQFLHYYNLTERKWEMKRKNEWIQELVLENS